MSDLCSPEGLTTVCNQSILCTAARCAEMHTQLGPGLCVIYGGPVEFMALMAPDLLIKNLFEVALWFDV